MLNLTYFIYELLSNVYNLIILLTDKANEEEK